MAEQKLNEGRKHHSNHNRTKKKKSAKTKAPFFPNSPTSVGSPKDDGSRFYPRQVHQRNPKKLCTLVLPPPLVSLFGTSGGNLDVATTSATTRLTAASENASLDGLSIMENTTPSHAHNPHRHTSNASVVSASVASVGGVGSGGSSVHHNPHLPLHLRVGMAPCDPLLVFDGRFVLVGTCDGRVAIYSIVDFEVHGGFSEDVTASERRRRAEWKEEDANMAMREQKIEGEEKKYQPKTESSNKISSEDKPPAFDVEEEEESEWVTRERMHRREKSKQTVEPILILSLPKKNHGSAEDDANKINTNGYDEESTINAPVTIATPPTIVAMCATPGTGASLIEQRCIVNSSKSSTIAEDQTETLLTRSQPLRPTFGKDLLGHVAVLTDDGEVHVLEFHRATAPLSVFQEECDAGGTVANGMNTNHIPLVNFVLSYRTGHLGATCICMHPVLGNNTNNKSSRHQSHVSNDSMHDTQQIRLCIGHHSGIVASFRIYSTCILPEVRKVSSSSKYLTSPKEGTKQEASTEKDTQHHSQEKPAPSSSTATHHHSRSKTTDFQDIGLSNIMHASPGKTAPRVLFHGADHRNVDTPLDFQRTFSEPIPKSDIQKGELTPQVGPAKVELCWQGKFEVPIRSLSSPGWGSPSKEEDQIECALLVVGLEHRQGENTNQVAMNAMAPSVPHYSLSPALSLEVINATLAEQKWCQIKTGPGRSKFIHLYDCSVWPAAGKEVKDAWMRGSPRKRGIDPRDKLYGVLGVQRTSVTNRICSFEGPGSCFVASSSDGTVTISHHSGDGSWGIMKEDNQIMLFQRCIGIGTIDLTKRYAICCLRGGTIYLVPVAENNCGPTSTPEMDPNDITMFSVPMDPDGDDDGLVRFVQNFTAGIAQVMMCWKDRTVMDKSHSIGSMSNSTMKPVAVVGWPGGNIDVYEITPERKSSTDMLIEDIAKRGIVTKLVLKLLEIDKSHSLISSDLWSKAWDECHKVSNLDAILEGIKDASTRDFVSMRFLLLSLAQ